MERCNATLNLGWWINLDQWRFNLVTRSSRDNVLFYRRLVVNTIMRFIRPRINKKNWEVNSYALTNYKLANFALTAPPPPAPPCTFVLSYSELINFVSWNQCLIVWGTKRTIEYVYVPIFFYTIVKFLCYIYIKMRYWIHFSFWKISFI